MNSSVKYCDNLLRQAREELGDSKIKQYCDEVADLTTRKAALKAVSVLGTASIHVLLLSCVDYTRFEVFKLIVEQSIDKSVLSGTIIDFENKRPDETAAEFINLKGAKNNSISLLAIKCLHSKENIQYLERIGLRFQLVGSVLTCCLASNRDMLSYFVREKGFPLLPECLVVSAMFNSSDCFHYIQENVPKFSREILQCAFQKAVRNSHKSMAEVLLSPEIKVNKTVVEKAIKGGEEIFTYITDLPESQKCWKASDFDETIYYALFNKANKEMKQMIPLIMKRLGVSYSQTFVNHVLASDNSRMLNYLVAKLRWPIPLRETLIMIRTYRLSECREYIKGATY